MAAVIAHTLRGGTAAERRSGTHDSGHRQPADAVADRLRKEEERVTRAALTATAHGTAGILETGPLPEVSVSGQHVRGPHQLDHDPEELQSRSGESRYPEKRDASHAEAFVRDGIAGSGCRSADDRPSAGPQKCLDDDGVPARASSAHGIHTESALSLLPRDRGRRWPTGRMRGRARHTTNKNEQAPSP